jgi:hypothetical protein
MIPAINQPLTEMSRRGRWIIRVWTEKGYVEKDQQVNSVSVRVGFFVGACFEHCTGRDRATAPEHSYTRRAEALPGACLMQVTIILCSITFQKPFVTVTATRTSNFGWIFKCYLDKLPRHNIVTKWVPQKFFPGGGRLKPGSARKLTTLRPFNTNFYRWL